jgi:hypothetical protein
MRYNIAQVRGIASRTKDMKHYDELNIKGDCLRIARE